MIFKMELNDFLIKAKIASYATAGEKDEIFNSDGSKELVYSENMFRYIDKYYGFNPFSGQEVVFNEKRSWNEQAGEYGWK